MSIRTREASQDDLPHIARLFDLHRQFYEQAPDAELARSVVEQRFLNRASRQLVAETAAGDIVGFCQLYPGSCPVEAAPIFLLYDLFVAPDARQGGVGRALLLAAEALARAEGKARMDLKPASTGLVARSLYESLGWTRDALSHGYSRRLLA